jgi:hypothetical protein
MRAGSLPAPLEREGLSRAGRSRKTANGKRGLTQRRGRKRPPVEASEDRTLEVVLARFFRVVAEVDSWCLAQRSERFHFTRFGSVRGRAPSPPTERAKARADEGRRGTGTGSKRKPSRDRTRDRRRPRLTRAKLAMEGTSDHEGRMLFTEHLPAWSWLFREVLAPSESGASLLGGATGVSEARWSRGCWAENAPHEPESHAEADRCAAKRRVPQSPFPGRRPWAKERGRSPEK